MYMIPRDTKTHNHFVKKRERNVYPQPAENSCGAANSGAEVREN